ncbi:hypothetical protein CJ030_MR4G007230 [Morella rubra]|uniref:Uncharacterized protein n=1 Tax=Morella rubra TaxID=262757 RepID=A0A6A1VSW8_9ROSI|nr:hypothetical protein CJ030_MR4G007230 [Morella rubra]
MLFVVYMHCKCIPPQSPCFRFTLNTTDRTTALAHETSATSTQVLLSRTREQKSWTNIFIRPDIHNVNSLFVRSPKPARLVLQMSC